MGRATHLYPRRCSHIKHRARCRDLGLPTPAHHRPVRGNQAIAALDGVTAPAAPPHPRAATTAAPPVDQTAARAAVPQAALAAAPMEIPQPQTPPNPPAAAPEIRGSPAVQAQATAVAQPAQDQTEAPVPPT